MTLIKLLSLRSRFLLAPVVAGLLMLSLYALQSYEFELKKQNLTELQKSNLPVVGEISQINMQMAKNQQDLHRAIDLIKSQHLDGFTNQKQQVLNELITIEHAFNSLMQRDFKNPMQPLIVEMFAHYSSHVTEAMLLAENNLEKARLSVDQSSQSLGEINQLLIGLSNHFITQLTIQSVKQEKTALSKWMPALLLLTLGITILAGLMMSNKMSLDLSQFNQALKDLSFGHHDVETPKTTDPYFKDLEKSVNSFKQVLQRNQQQQFFLEQSHQRYETLLNLIPTAIIALDKHQNITLFNQAAEEIFRFNAHEVLGKSITLLIPEFTPQSQPMAEAGNIIELASANEIKPTPQDAMRKSGEPFLIEIHLSNLEVISEELTTLAITDVTARHEAEEKIWKQAHYDALTHLPNRLFSINSLEHTIKLAKRNQHKVAVMFIDLDNFKKVNDTLGHTVGDQLLIEVANRLSAQVRQTDIVGRLSGDEFVITLGGLKQIEGIERTIDNIIQNFREPIVVNDQELVTTLSMGIAVYPDDAVARDDLLQKADIAMYHAKESGRNGYAFYQGDMHERIQRRIDIEAQLSQALLHDEFEVYYQCQHHSKTQTVNGAEALLRWNNALLGPIPPNEFIPIAEQNGQIIAIGEFVMHEAVKQLKRLHELMPDNKLSISVNLSPMQFRDPQLLDKIDHILQTHKMDAKYLHLEITEGILMSAQQETSALLKAMKQRGLSISIDDFGTGYSSLSYLQKFSFDSLKIDRSFVKNCTANRSDQHLIKAIIAMAHALDLKVVVEGVETREQFEFLVAAQGDSIQGYFFCEPAPAAQLEQFLKEQTQTLKQVV